MMIILLVIAQFHRFYIVFTLIKYKVSLNNENS